MYFKYQSNAWSKVFLGFLPCIEMVYHVFPRARKAYKVRILTHFARQSQCVAWIRVGVTLWEPSLSDYALGSYVANSFLGSRF